MENPKHHHFVPKWYLEKFTDPHSGFLHVYDRIIKTWRKQKPNKLMKINRFYKQRHVPKGIDPYILEKELGSWLEPEGKDALEKLLCQPSELTAEDSAAILAYLELQRIRVPRQAEMVKQLLMTFRDTVLLDGLPPELASAVMVSDSFRFSFMRAVIGSLMPYFARMKWTIVKAREGDSFITSDSPVAFFNSHFLPPHEPGLALAGTMVFFPLDSQHLLWLQHQELIDKPNVYRSEIVPETKLNDGVISLTHGVEWTDEQICSLNWTMLELSHRIIVGADKDIIEKAVNFCS